MTKNFFNAKKVLMSTIAAVVFSFVFTTSANAGTQNDVKKNDTEVPQPSYDKEKGELQDLPEIISYIIHTIFGVRV